MHQQPFAFADVDLARRLERAEGRASALFVEARARCFPESAACWMEVAGAYAMYDGVSSPLTQTFGLGLFDPVTDREIERLERFFRERGAAVIHEVSPLAGLPLAARLHERGYKPVEFTSVLYRPIAGDALALNPRIQVRPIREGEGELWGRTAARGWSHIPDIPESFFLDMGRLATRQDTVSFVAELAGEPIAAGALSVHQGVVLLAGACTVPEARRQGAQLALLDARLRCGAERGCDIAMMCAEPGSASQRNAERHGFRVAYTRIKWQAGAAG